MKERSRKREPQKPKEPTFPITKVERLIVGGDRLLVIKFELPEGGERTFNAQFIFVKQRVINLLQKFKGANFYEILQKLDEDIQLPANSTQEFNNESEKRNYLIMHCLEKIVTKLFEVKKRNELLFNSKDIIAEEYILVPKIRDLSVLLPSQQ